MKIRIWRRPRIDIADSGALSDLAFLLIIFFIVIAVFNINSGFLLGLPRKNSVRVVASEEILRVGLTASGEFVLKGVPSGQKEVEDAATRMRKEHPNMTFLLRIHPDTPYQKVVDVIDLVRNLEVDNFSFVMDANP